LRSRSVAAAIAVSLLSAGGAVACFYRSSQLRTDGEWYLARGNAEAEEYASTLDSAVAEKQLATFEQRREILEKAHVWQRLQLLLILCSVVAAFGSYVLYLFFRLRQQLVEGGEVEAELSVLPHSHRSTS
jgi:hypothetical protein